MTKTLGGNPHQKSLGEEIWATLDPLLKTLERCTGPRVFKQWPLRYQLHLLQLSQLLAQPSHLRHFVGERSTPNLHGWPLSLSHTTAPSDWLGEQLGQAQLLLPEDASGAGSIAAVPAACPTQPPEALLWEREGVTALPTFMGHSLSLSLSLSLLWAVETLSLSHNSAPSDWLGEQLGQAQLLLPEDASGAGSIEMKRKKNKKREVVTRLEIIEIHC